MGQSAEHRPVVIDASGAALMHMNTATGLVTFDVQVLGNFVLALD